MVGLNNRLSTLECKQLFSTDYRDLYIHMIVKNLKHMECDEVAQIIEDNSHIEDDSLTRIVKLGTDHILPGSLIDDIFVELTGLSTITKKTLLANLQKCTLCTSVQNIVTALSNRVATPRNFSLPLYLPQRAVLSRMLRLEKMKPYKMGGKYITPRIGVLSEKLGFGKSLLSCALLAASRDVSPHHVPSSSQKYVVIPETKKDLPFVSMNIVLCSLKKTSEWYDNVKSYTDLEPYKITSSKMLEHFLQRWKQNNPPDVLIVKDGKLKGIPVLETVKEILSGKCVSRLIVDDYDVLNISPTCEYPAARFYWLVSSTGLLDVSSKQITGRNYPCLQSFSTHMVLLNKLTNVRCSPNFLTEEYCIPIIETFVKDLGLEDSLCKKCSARTKNTHCEKCVADVQGSDAPFNTCGKCPSCEEGYWELCEINENKPICPECYSKTLEEYTPCTRCRKNSIRSRREEIQSAIEDFLTGVPQERLQDIPRYYKKLLPGMVDKPAHIAGKIKALFLAEDNASDWNFTKIRTSGITTRNIQKFESSLDHLGICKKLSGIDLSYITHIIVTNISKSSDIVQFIGRAQRIGRENNLRVLLIR